MFIAIGVVLLILAVLIGMAIRQAHIYKKSATIYFRPETEAKLMAVYDRALDKWPVKYTSHMIENKYGTVHVIECGNTDSEDLVLLHAASVGAVSWIKNVEALGETYHLYAIDVLGEGNKSRLADVNKYPETEKEMVDLYHDVFSKLGIVTPHLAGASYGGFIALNYAKNYGDQIKDIMLLGPMGISESVPKVLFTMMLYTFYPYRIFSDPMVKWTVGDTAEIGDTKDYFETILAGVLGRYYRPRTLAKEYLEMIDVPTLLILGEKDQLVGSPEKAKKYVSCIKDLKTVVLDSGHLINVEKAPDVNKLMLAFLKQ